MAPAQSHRYARLAPAAAAVPGALHAASGRMGLALEHAIATELIEAGWGVRGVRPRPVPTDLPWVRGWQSPCPKRVCVWRTPCLGRPVVHVV